MDLGTRVKKALYDPEGTVASHGDVDQHNTPGAYPDTPANESGPDAADPTAVFGSSQTKHNKLHKREDPRGWAGDSHAGLSHKHTDSGVGLTGGHDAFSSSSPTQQHQPGMIPGMEHESGGGAYTHSAPNTTGVDAPPPTATHGLEQQNRQQSPWAEGAADVKSDPYRGAALGNIVPLLDSHRDTEMREDAQQQHQPSGTTTNKDIANTGLTNVGHTGTGTTNTSSTDHDVAHKTRQPGDVVQDHPYWGDLPHGGGVYNSVTGHGSEEDQKKRQQELYQQETQGLSGQHPSTVAGLSDTGRDATSYQTPAGLTGSHGDTSRLGEREDSSHKKDALLGGAGGAATASAAAATAYKMHERDNNTSDKAPLQEQQHSSGEKKERRKSFGLFNRSKDDDHHHHKDKTKHTDESKSDKKHSFGGLFHRSSGDKETHDDSTTRDVRRDDADRKHHDDSNTAAYTMAGAGAGLGAGGAAAYMANRDRKDDQDDVKDRSALGGHQHHHHQPESKVHEHQQKQSYGTHTEPQHQYQDSSQHATRGYDEQDSKHSRNMTGAAAATAAGLGAGAVASRHRDDESRDEQIKTRHQLPESETRGAYANTTSVNPMVGSSFTSGNTHSDKQPPALTDQANRGDYSHLSSGTASGVEPMIGSSSAGNTHANKQPPTLTDHANRGDYHHLSSGTASGVEPTLGSSSSTNDSRTKQAPPAIAGHANHGEYNLLSSGTPSGVRLDEDSTDNKNKTSFQPQHTIPEARSQEHDKSRAGAAGLGAAGLGAAAAGGAAAYQSRDRSHDGQEAERRELEKLKPAEEDQVKRFEREEARGKDKSETRTFPLVPGAGGASHKTDKVIHRCRKCGEENDITSYVTQGRH